MNIHNPPKGRKGTLQADLQRYPINIIEFIPLHRPKATKTLPSGKVVPMGKAPLHAKWTTKAYDSKTVRDEAIEQGRNVGVRLKADQLVLDIDPRNNGTAGFAALCFDLGFDPDAFPRVITGSGGFHIYMSKPADVLIRDTLESDAYNGVEFKSKGRQVVAAGSIHPNGSPYYWSPDHPRIEDGLPPVPEALLNAIKRPPRSAVQGGGQYSPAQIADVLARLDVTKFADNDSWLQLMMAIHHASAGEARNEFLEWSAQDPDHANSIYMAGKRWDSLHADRHDGVTYKTLNMILRKHGAADAQVAHVADDEFPALPGAAAEFDAMDDEPKGAAAEFDAMPDDDGVAPESAPLAEWQFIVESMQFIHNDGFQIWNKDQFGMKFGYLARKGDIIKSIKQGRVWIRQYDRQVYIPNGAPVVNYEGVPAFNIWRPSAMTPKAGDHQWFLDHIAYMFPDAKSQDYVLDYMAQLIQFPEVKIHFALLIQSTQGVGKGALAMILRRMIGKRNSVEPSNDEVTKQWTGWQEGAQLAIINELMAGGSAVVLNRLKSPITEDTLRIEKKFGNSFSIPNHMNLFAMTNHKDALPIPADDRRWLILFSAAKKRKAEYYDRLFENIADDSKVAAVMQFLLDRFITLNPKGPAPMTEAKRDMADRSKSDVAIRLQDLFDERRAPFDFPLVRMADIVAKIKEEPGEKNANKTASNFLDDIGAVKLDRDKNAVPSYQLYAIRDHAKYRSMGRAETLAEFIATHPDLGPDHEDDACP